MKAEDLPVEAQVRLGLGLRLELGLGLVLELGLGLVRARVRVRVRVRIRVRVRVRLEDVEVAELDGGVLERVLLLAHGARGAQRQGLLFRQAEELPVLGDVERRGLPSRDGLLLLLGRGFGLGFGLGTFEGDRVRVRKTRLRVGRVRVTVGRAGVRVRGSSAPASWRSSRRPRCASSRRPR